MKQHLKLRALCEGAIFVAISYVLSFLKVFQMPQGGSVSLMALPVLLYAVRWGLSSGLLAGCALGLLDCLVGGIFLVSWVSFLGDYIVAGAALGLAGLFRRYSGGWGYFAGIAVGSLGRWAAWLVTGATLWKQYMPEGFTFLGISNNPWVYSFWYNSYAIVSGLLCLLVGGILFSIPALRNYFTGSDLPRQQNGQAQAF
ncbi:MAG: Substrate-specific component ThiT of thiamine transporter [Oscillospiraceae bacterium]|nr:Substrate-specific component ThiT of thiamine transporter [Oscillospiraceae bacterium]